MTKAQAISRAILYGMLVKGETLAVAATAVLGEAAAPLLESPAMLMATLREEAGRVGAELAPR